MRTALLVAIGLTLPEALGGQICVPEAFGVPGLYGQPPRWRAAGPSFNFPSEMDRLDDPRWRGATGQVLNNGEAEFRALYKADSLYLSWQAKVDGSLDAGANPDRVLFGIKQVPGKPATVIELRLTVAAAPLNAAPGPSSPPAAVGFFVYQWNGANWNTVSTPSWLGQTTRVWTKYEGTNNAWAFQTVLPISAMGLANGLDITSPFEMWYALLVVAADGSVPEYRWPTTIPQIRQTSGSLLLPVISTTWETMNFGTNVTCPANVALDPLQIGTDQSPDDKIAFTSIAVDPAQNNFKNEFHARPQNVGTTTILQHSVEARFFLANWGSQNPVSTLWNEITLSPPPKNDADILPGDVAVGGPSRNDIHFLGSVPASDRCRFGDPDASCAMIAKFPHQCMLVQLSSSATALTFRNQSVYRNMNFAKLSTLERTAEISVRGLTPIPDGHATRDVYLYVETHNLPQRTNSAARSADTTVVPGKDTAIVARRDTVFKTEWGLVRVAQGDTVVMATKDTIVIPARDGLERLTSVQTAARAGRLSSEQVDALLPTYRVHAYHATRDTLTINGLKHAVLEPQTSFGYYVGHHGEIVGWRYELKGAGLIELAPNLYKIAVPNNGVATVTTIIEALEPPGNAFSLHAGISLPHGNFKNAYKNGFGITADFEHRLSSTFRLAALLGYHRFETATTGAHLDLYHISGSLETFLTPGPVIVFVDAGGGVYRLNPGATKAGAHAGLNIEYEVSSSLSLGGSYRFHKVFTSGSTTTFSSIQAGGHVRF